MNCLTAMGSPTEPCDLHLHNLPMTAWNSLMPCYNNVTNTTGILNATFITLCTMYRS